MRMSSCFILMSDGGLIDSMQMSLPPGGDGTLESSSGGVLGPGDGGDDSQEESDEESE